MEVSKLWRWTPTPANVTPRTMDGRIFVLTILLHNATRKLRSNHESEKVADSAPQYSTKRGRA